MRVVLLCLALAACGKPPTPTVEYVFIQPEEQLAYPRHETPPAANVQAAAVVRKERHLSAEVGRYVSWKQSKPPIIDHLGDLMATMRAAVALVQNAKTLRDRAAALPAAVAATEAVQNYLATKGD